MSESYHRDEAARGPMVLERLSDLNEARKLLGDFTDIRGMAVRNPNGEEVGRVDNLFIDPKQGKLAMASITFGGVWGFGSRRVLVPIDQLEIVEGRFVRIVSTPEIVKGAPEFEQMEGSDFRKYHQYWHDALKQSGEKKAA